MDKMDQFFLVVLTVTIFTIGNVHCRNSVYGTIQDNVTWFYANLSVVPAMTASLEYHVQFPASQMIHKPIITFYYDGENSPNVRDKCERDLYGQLRNEDLAVPLRGVYRDKFYCYKQEDIMYCQGKTKIQDFEPKSYSFSFATSCKNKIPVYFNGLFYNVTIYDESNKTSCVDLNLPDGQRIDHCERHYQYGAIPNQIGNTDLDTALRDLQLGLDIMDQLLVLVTHKKCVEELYQLACLIVLPECLPEENQIVLPCREDCNSMLKACLKWEVIAILADKYILNCDYLPPKNGSMKCYSQYDVCGPPPQINHGFILEGDMPFAKKGHVVHYACNESLSLSGIMNSTCQASGEWTRPPKCANHVNLIMVICVAIGCFTVLVLGGTVVTYLCVTKKRKTKKTPRRSPLVVDNTGHTSITNRSTEPLVDNNEP